MTALHQKAHLTDDDRRALRAHHERYGIDAKSRQRAARTLESLDALLEPLLMAVDDVGGSMPALNDVGRALRLLAEGPSGRFR